MRRDVYRHPILERPGRGPADTRYFDDSPRLPGYPSHAGLPDPGLAARHTLIDVRHAHLQEKTLSREPAPATHSQ